MLLEAPFSKETQSIISFHNDHSTLTYARAKESVDRTKQSHQNKDKPLTGIDLANPRQRQPNLIPVRHTQRLLQWVSFKVDSVQLLFVLQFLLDLAEVFELAVACPQFLELCES